MKDKLSAMRSVDQVDNKDVMYSLRICKAIIVLIAAALAVSLAVAMAQNRTEQTQNASPAPAVKLNVLVLDDSKHAVNDVTQDEFHVFEDEAEQKITLFSKDEVPLSYGLVIDNSGSLRSQIEEVVEAAKGVVHANRPEDETFVMRFVDTPNINILQDFTSNTAALDRSLGNLFPEGGKTALIDAVYTAAKHVAERKKSVSGQNRRYALILISDGEDRQSVNKAETLFNFLRENDVQIFVIGLVEMLEKESNVFAKKSTRREATGLLEQLAKETGGRVFYPNSADDLPETVNDIMRDLHTQYVIGYNPASNPKSKPYRKVKVTITGAKGREKRTAITRSGYTARVN
jgi:Ca-activated chloride channel family protein